MRRGYSFPHPSAAPPDCESIQTNILWRKVLRSCKTAGKQGPKPGPGYQRSTEPLKSSSSRTLSPSTLPSKASTVLAKTKSPRVTDKDFQEQVFPRYGITVTTLPHFGTPYEYFDTEDPREQGYGDSIQEWYQQKQGHQDCNVWLSIDKEKAEEIAGQYDTMIFIGENEARLSHRGKNYFFHEDKISRPKDESRCSSTYFKLEWAPNPDGKHLRCPPELEDCGSRFAFTTNPDCTYWLTIRRMNVEYREIVGDYTFVLAGAEAATPYLTIEFKKDGQSFEAAENQVAVSGMLILYNRFRLRCDRLEALKIPRESVKPEHFDGVQHFGIAINRCKPSLYVLRPRLTFDNLMSQDAMNLQSLWAGCDVVKLKILDLTQVRGVLAFADWVNELNHWGLSTHSQQVVTDLKALLLQLPNGFRVSLSNEERAELAPDSVNA